jgi:DNA (cytosine-5)-methyltransferase 1
MDSISLFSGCGGMDFGFEAAGFSTRVTLERDRACCATLRANRAWPVLERDIFTVSTEELLATAGLKRKEPALLCGGPPCQPFSKAGFWATGETRRLSDERAGTLSAYLRVLREALPAAFVLENVAGLAFVDKDEGLRYLLDEVQRINRAEGTRYLPQHAIMRAVEHGVPQQRERLFLVAFRDGAPFAFPAARFAEPDPQLRLDPLPKPRTAWDALGDLPEPPAGDELAVTGKWAALLPSIPEGQNYLWHTDRGGGEPLFGWRRRFWNFLLKLAKDRPAWTIPAQPGPATGPFHWNNRRLSLRELCRLQTFPDDITLTGDFRDVQKQAGNAVPSLLTEVLGRIVHATLSGSRLPAGPPSLLPPLRLPVPAPEPVRSVLARFLHRRHSESAHPGTGKGFGAMRRADPVVPGMP